MGILNRIRKIIKNKEKSDSVSSAPLEKLNPGRASVEYARTLSFNQHFEDMLNWDRFIARSDYKNFIQEYSDLFQFYETLSKSGLLGRYIESNGLEKPQIEKFILTYRDISELTAGSEIVKKHNDSFIATHIKSEKNYLDNILKECDPAIMLDNEQREVVLSDEDNTLVIAGAGAGKTTTVAAKVRYLVEKQCVDPKKILVISFTNKAVDELKERINYKLGISCPITTFHSVGYTILRKNQSFARKIVDGGFMWKIINEYLKSTILRRPEIVEKLVLFFGSYFSAPYEGDDLNEYFQFIAQADFSTIRSNLHEYVKRVVDRRTQKIQTLNNEILRSMEEVRIANFLYMNSIEYEYEPIYQYRILDAKKPYTPDFRISQGDKTSYIEHFGITESGTSNRYSQDELERYKSSIRAKVRLHKEHNTDLIYTFSAYKDGNDFLSHLRESLLRKGYILKPRPAAEVYRNLVDSEEGKYITPFTSLICNFISNFKIQGYGAEKFSDFKSSTKNIRTQLFLDICEVCYYEYQQALEENRCIDFQDMINESAELIHRKQLAKEQLDFKYIIVDEYQDISRQRYNLITEMSKLCDAKIIAVGDDWQSIYAFSGSVLPLFTRFCEEVGYGQELKITRTYRNAQEIIDIAGTFIQRNSLQIKKELISPKHISNPVIIFPYPEKVENGKGKTGFGKNVCLGEAVNEAIEEIMQYNAAEGKPEVASVLLIGRYGFDARHLCHSSEFSYDEKTGKVYSSRFGSKVKLYFLTAHSSKGLSADNVIIINAKDAQYGFPSKIEDDPVLNLVITNDDSCDYAEERRLFYVALTRTKNRVCILAPERRPSEFIKELLRDSELYPNVMLRGELKSALNSKSQIKDCCPVCGYPLQLRYNKNYGLKLWICTNDQEICGFMTNDLRGNDLSIHKCDWCNDGYLVVKSGEKGFFLGCSNYKHDKSGCNRMLSHESYLAWKNNDFGEKDSSEDKQAFMFRQFDEMDDMPKMRQEPKILKENRPLGNAVNSVQYELKFIEKDGFKVLADASGTILTDMDLLKKLRDLRNNIASERKLFVYRIVKNDALVRLATDKPVTREELLLVRGISERICAEYGEFFINAIRQHIGL